MSSQKISVEEYLAAEESSEIRHEYIGGVLYAMTGASERHGLIAVNLAAYLRPLLRGTDCQLFISDMKLRLHIGGEEIFYYPDLLLSCDPEDREISYRRSPCLIIEILSEATARIDRHEKRLAYQTIQSLQEYLLIDQDQRAVTIYRRRTDWQAERVTEGNVQIDCLGIGVPLDVIYEDVDLWKV